MMFGLFRKKKHLPEAPQKKKTLQDALADHVTDVNGWEIFAERMGLLGQAAPAANSTNAMDSAPLFEGIKDAYAFAQPNLPEALVAWFALQSFIGWQTAALAAQSPFINKCCYMPGRDAVRHGWQISVKGLSESDDENAILDAIRKADKKYSIHSQLREFVHFGRVFGVRHAIFHVDGADNNYFKNPFNPDGIKPRTYKGISQVDPYWMTPLLDGDAAANAASRHFYEPTWWNIQGKEYHRTHVCIFRNSSVADILKPTYLYGGIPVPQQIMERLYGADRTANEAPSLVMTKRTLVWKTDVAQLAGSQEKFLRHMQSWVAYRDNYGTKLINGDGAEGDSVNQFDTTLADLDAVIMTQYQLVAGIANIPATKLLGTTPKGFNATGEYEESNYHEELESIQDDDLTPLLERHYTFVMRSEIAPEFGLDPNKVEIEIDWNPLDSPTAKEYAEINEINSRTDVNLVNAGAIDALDVRNRLKNDPNSTYTGLPDPAPDEEDDMIAKSLGDPEEQELKPVGQTSGAV